MALRPKSADQTLGSVLGTTTSNNLPFGRTPDPTLAIDGVTNERQQRTTAEFRPDGGNDWRVRLSLPNRLKDSLLINPLLETDGLVWPYTPSIIVQNSADYQMLSPIHNNYPYPVYQGSRVDQFTISGDFVVETQQEARYWIGAVHYLRSITKMDYGNQGSGEPPPVVKLNGYGEYVFNNVPVVVQSFQIDLPNNVDYISTSLSVVGRQGEFGNGAVSQVPTQSLITVTVIPAYSRSTVANFSLQKFINGDYVSQGNGFI